MGFTIFIDESGDTGIAKLRDEEGGGSSPYFVMGAIILNRSTEIVATKVLDQLQSDFHKTKRWKHATNLSHIQKVHFAQAMASIHCRAYGLVSYKPTLEGYADEINWEPHKFYNKCIKYLLEIIARDLSRFSPNWEKQRIVVEKRNHDYDALRRFLSKVKDNPIYPQSKHLHSINPFALVAKEKSDEDLLRLADFVSHALYSCVNLTPDNFFTPEPRYLNEMIGRFAADERGRVLGAGIKCIHKIEDMELTPEIRHLFPRLRAKPPSTHS